MSLIVITPPATEPVTLAEARGHCRIDGPADDALLARYIIAAREAVEHELQRSVVSKTYELTLDEFPAGTILLPMAPAVPGSTNLSVTSVKYTDSADVEQTIAGSSYTLDGYGHQPRLVPTNGWPTPKDAPNAVRVRYVSGPPAGEVPSSIVAWMLLHVAAAYENREALVTAGSPQVLPSAARLLDPYRSFL